MSARHSYDVNALGSALMAMEPVPSGIAIELFEVLVDEVAGEDWLRFRFLAPELANETNGLTFEQVQADFDHLCGTVALPYISQFDLQADVVVISLLDRPVAFGEADPDATQLIEAFRVSEDECVWEGLW